MQVKNSMSKNTQFAAPDATIAEIATMMERNDCGSIPVGEDNKLVGMITDRDIVLRCIADRQDPQKMTAKECMSGGILYCFEDDDVEDVLKNMGDQAVKRLPVVNRQKNLVGIVSFGDLSKACEDKRCSGEAMEKIREAA